MRESLYVSPSSYLLDLPVALRREPLAHSAVLLFGHLARFRLEEFPQRRLVQHLLLGRASTS